MHLQEARLHVPDLAHEFHPFIGQDSAGGHVGEDRKHAEYIESVAEMITAAPDNQAPDIGHSRDVIHGFREFIPELGAHCIAFAGTEQCQGHYPVGQVQRKGLIGHGVQYSMHAYEFGVNVINRRFPATAFAH